MAPGSPAPLKVQIFLHLHICLVVVVVGGVSPWLPGAREGNRLMEGLRGLQVHASMARSPLVPRHSGQSSTVDQNHQGPHTLYTKDRTTLPYNGRPLGRIQMKKSDRRLQDSLCHLLVFRERKSQA